MMKSFFSKLLKKREQTELAISIEDLKKKKITLVTKKISGKGTYRVYINEWKYNLEGFKLKEESRHSINASYLVDGVNVLRVVVRDNDKEIVKTLYKEFEYLKVG